MFTLWAPTSADGKGRDKKTAVGPCPDKGLSLFSKIHKREP